MPGRERAAVALVSSRVQVDLVSCADFSRSILREKRRRKQLLRTCTGIAPLFSLFFGCVSHSLHVHVYVANPFQKLTLERLRPRRLVSELGVRFLRLLIVRLDRFQNVHVDCAALVVHSSGTWMAR